MKYTCAIKIKKKKNCLLSSFSMESSTYQMGETRQMHYMLCFEPQWLNRKAVCFMSGSKHGAQNKLLISHEEEVGRKKNTIGTIFLTIFTQD